jgi:omega-hydroxy-beta-dihydromenaquinone-9 sulfotransferase
MAKEDPQNINQYSLLSPRFWHGMRFPYWFSLLRRNGFRISWSRAHLVAGVSLFTPWNDLLALIQHLGFGRAIQKTELAGPPIFVLGHWRSGTTLLHEYLALDDRFASPTTFQCFAPWHFLLTESLVTRFGGFLLPERRPMDNMKAGWSLPQEDEFALMNLGAPTPYLRILFPLEPIPFEGTLVSDGFTESELHQWKRTFDWFMRAVTYKTGKPLILKSPPHTGRLGVLRSMYPDAKFVHIVRDPRKIYPSTMKLWKTLDQLQAVQSPTDLDQLQSFVLRTLPRMVASFEKDRVGLSESQLIELRYEDLVADPVGMMARIYDQLQLGDFAPVKERIAAKVQQEREYQTNRLDLKPEEEKMVMDAWQEYAKRYGYA